MRLKIKGLKGIQEDLEVTLVDGGDKYLVDLGFGTTNKFSVQLDWDVVTIDPWDSEAQ